MSLPSYTISGQKQIRWWIEKQLEEIQREGVNNPLNYPDWLPMMWVIFDYCKSLEDRIKDLEDKVCFYQRGGAV